MKPNIRSVTYILLIVSLVWIVACAPRTPSPLRAEFSPLVNRGILALSTSNPYVGANLFLSQEMSESGHLYNFLNNRGGPLAIEIIDDYVAPVRVLMFYPGERQVFSADVFVSPSPEKGLAIKEWIIRGPYPMERNDFRTLQESISSLNGEPVFNYQGRTLRFRQGNNRQEQRGASSTTTNLTYPSIPTPVPPTPRPVQAKPRPITAPKVPATPNEAKGTGMSDIPQSGPLTLDQRALLMSQGYADRAANGDVLHTTKIEGESLAAIAAWYTGSDKNAAAIAAYNQIETQQHLAPGLVIKVPANLVKNWKALKK